MDITGLIIMLAIGAVAGWLAGQIISGGGFGLIGNIIIGILGAVIAGFVLGPMFGGGLIGSIISATIGAVILLVIIGFIKRAT